MADPGFAAGDDEMVDRAREKDWSAQGVIEELQRILLRLNQVPTSYAIATAYQSGRAGFAGGDWYDAIRLSDDLTGVVVGDVFASGIAAAAAMGQLRSAATAAALVDPSPARVLEAMDRLAAHSLDTGYATAVYGVLSKKSETFEYCIAGHVPPLLVTPPGIAKVLDDGRRWPLGLERPRSNRTARADFPPGSLLLLYTDGLVERPGESIDLGLYRLARGLERLWHLPTPLICDQLLATLVNQLSPTDDVAILAIRDMGGSERSYADVIPGAVSELPQARHRLRDWLELVDISEPDRDAFVLAMSEAIANAIFHGSNNNPKKQVTIEASLDHSDLVGCIRDSGGRLPDSHATGEWQGLGFRIMAEVVDEVDCKVTAGFTRIVLRRSRQATVGV